MKTVLITGCSSGFGLETARHFLARDWQVVATMRNPRQDILASAERLRVLALDVTDADSIRRTVEAAGPVDVLVNNAGTGALAPVEGMSMDRVREVYATNVLGTIAMTQAVLPGMRQQGGGVIVNVSSSTTLMPLPYLSVYRGSKAAVNAFSECLAAELEPFAIRVRVVIPGRSPETSFASNAQRDMKGGVPPAYAEHMQRFFQSMQQASPETTYAIDVAEAIWRAATDPGTPLRILAGADAVSLSRSK
jgi:NAD(P)-dependent dehydrogenase (short-subunit alcohol dehydrogenase family)